MKCCYATPRNMKLSGGESEKRLISDLFDKNGYNPLIRPVVNTNDTLNIRFNLALSQIINVDEVNQVMKTNVWLQVYWYDYQLKWDPAMYGNIGSIRIKPDKVWVPDFVLFNNADGNFEVTYKSNCVLYANSEVHWIPPAIYHSSCSIDVRYFPFDQQTCEMKFGSWTHKGKALKYSFYMNRNKLDLVDYLKSGSWDIIDCPGEIVTYTDEISGEQKEQIVFQFVLRRKTLFYTVNLIIPCVLISFVTICVFALPADAGEKITLCISVLLALVVFLLLVSKILPPSLTIPLIAKYLLFTFIMNLVAIFSTVVIINRNYRTPRTHKMPNWIRVIFLRQLPKFLLMTRPDHDERSKQTMVSSSAVPKDTFTPETRRLNFAMPHNFVELSEVPRHRRPVGQVGQSSHCTTESPASCSNNNPSGSKSRNNERLSEHFRSSLHRKRTEMPHPPLDEEDSSDDDPWEMTPELRKTIDAVKFIYNHMKNEEEYETILEDWKYVARVLDRLMLIVFLLVTLAGTAGILLNAPHILEYVDQDKIIKELVDYIAQAEAGANEK
ncbi:non-alpha nicotinic acetylcholine receptor subunit [Plakobranchus ocellatus]|uniref:Non-alpha nicotinic acetylcholine receptor subunit n=1 Tax=Plakobranchus ocellatus TaxID=259542 RepID=A0AAV3YE86_9GAST|nr:non-alpha nicotinic acetylcholine receptor subunit [Plakobranchus ocellatus]